MRELIISAEVRSVEITDKRRISITISNSDGSLFFKETDTAYCLGLQPSEVWVGQEVQVKIILPWPPVPEPKYRSSPVPDLTGESR